jgi:hypothetical protein
MKSNLCKTGPEDRDNPHNGTDGIQRRLLLSTMEVYVDDHGVSLFGCD